MQKLTGILHGLRQQRGSALIGAVALGSILAIAALGYLQLVRSQSNNESSFLDEAKAFYSVESGLALGSRYARTLTVMGAGQIQTMDSASPVFSNLSLNGDTVTAMLHSISDNCILVISKSNNNVLSTGKRMRMSWKASTSFNIFTQLYGGYLINAFSGSPSGWYATREFNGRFHMNGKLSLKGFSDWSNNSFTFRGGLVSTSDNTASSAPCALAPSANENGYKNNFSNGISFCGSGAPTLTMVNNWFHDQYLSGQPAVNLDTALRTKVQAAATISLPAGVTPTGETFSDSNVVNGTNPPIATWRPTLEFRADDGKAHYHYYSAAGTSKDSSFNPDGKVIYVPTSLNVLGVVKTGTRATVVTAPDMSISIVADANNTARGNALPGIVYQDVTEDADGVHLNMSAASTTALALISGQYVRYQESWKKHWAAGDSSVIQVRDNAVGSTASPAGDGYLNACGAFIATADTDGCAKYNNWAYGGTSGNSNANNRYYALRAFGSSTFNKYAPHCYYQNAGTTVLTNHYFADERLAVPLTYPGQRPVTTLAGGVIIYHFANWQVNFF